METLVPANRRFVALPEMPDAFARVFAHAYVSRLAVVPATEGTCAQPCARRDFQTAQSREHRDRKADAFTRNIFGNVRRKVETRNLVGNAELPTGFGRDLALDGVVSVAESRLCPLETNLCALASVATIS